ncbi:hypothetical protein [uncultured Cocleimonas sp.]|uniref:hypothetical protein n=1 Tax=uncultured Cocleimonas sp. TaxID=1051587 RepID=UPI0026251450|nr:hypothetical protein [uncultured Cocleimonas sp.]
MKIQLLTAAVVIAFTSTAAFATGGKPNGPKPMPHKGATLTNNSTNALAIGSSTGSANGLGGFTITTSGERAVAGSIYLENCACDFDSVSNTSNGAIAVGAATAGSIHVGGYSN